MRGHNNVGFILNSLVKMYGSNFRSIISNLEITGGMSKIDPSQRLITPLSAPRWESRKQNTVPHKNQDRSILPADFQVSFY